METAFVSPGPHIDAPYFQNPTPGVLLSAVCRLFRLNTILPPKLNTLVTRPDGNALIVPPNLPAVEPKQWCMVVSPPLRLETLLRNRKKPRPVPRLGQVLSATPNLVRVEARMPLVTTPLLTAPVSTVLPWVPTMCLRALPLREVQFPIALINRGTRLRCRPSRMLTLVNVPLWPPCNPINEPHKEMT